MGYYYFDTSGLVKRYLDEIGSPWVRAITDAQATGSALPQVVAIVSIGIVEAISAFSRRYRNGLINEHERQTATNLFLSHTQGEYEILPVDSSIIDLATDLVQRHPLRGYDAVHLAAALRLRDRLVTAGLAAPTFVSADRNLCTLARAEGMAAENPNDSP